MNAAIPPTKATPESLDSRYPIVIEGLSTSFGANRVHENLSLTVRRGEILGVVGGSGTGKSVLMRTIIALQRPDAGRITVLGHDVLHHRGLRLRLGHREPDEAIDDSMNESAHADVSDIRSRWGVLFQGGALFSTLTVTENVAVPLREFHPDIEPRLLEEIAGLKVMLSGLPRGVGQNYPAELSGGMRKRAGLARALALDPELLFLDEPTAGLDPIAAAGFDTLLRELHETLGLTVFLITHDLDTLYAICDRVAVIAERRVIAVGTIPELIATGHPWITAYFCGVRGRAAMAGRGVSKR